MDDIIEYAGCCRKDSSTQFFLIVYKNDKNKISIFKTIKKDYEAETTIEKEIDIVFNENVSVDNEKILTNEFCALLTENKNVICIKFIYSSGEYSFEHKTIELNDEIKKLDIKNIYATRYYYDYYLLIDTSEGMFIYNIETEIYRKYEDIVKICGYFDRFYLTDLKLLSNDGSLYDIETMNKDTLEIDLIKKEENVLDIKNPRIIKKEDGFYTKEKGMVCLTRCNDFIENSEYTEYNYFDQYRRIDNIMFKNNNYIFPLRNIYNICHPKKLKTQIWQSGLSFVKTKGKWEAMFDETLSPDGTKSIFCNLNTQRYPEIPMMWRFTYGSWDIGRADGLTSPTFNYPGQSTVTLKFYTEKQGKVKATLRYGGYMTPSERLGITLSNSEEVPSIRGELSADKIMYWSGTIDENSVQIEKDLPEGVNYVHITLRTDNPNGINYNTTYIYLRSLGLEGFLDFKNNSENEELGNFVFNPNADWNLENTWLKMNGYWNGNKQIHTR